MGRGDNRRTLKMKRRRSQAKFKARKNRRREVTKARAASRPSSSPMAEAAQPRYVNAADLIAAIDARVSEAAPIVWSPAVREEFTARNLRTGERREAPSVSRNGQHFERADHDACCSGELQKWKRGNTVGWSLSQARDQAGFARAAASAIATGAQRLDYDISRWRPFRFEPTTGEWVA